MTQGFPDTMGVLLAAGQSRRFGAPDKLLAQVGGQALVCHPARALAGLGCGGLAAVLSSDAVAAALPPGFQPIRIAPDQPMARSLLAALDHARRAGAGRLLICLGDMPGVTGATLARLLARPGDAACVQGGRRLPPVVIAAHSFAAVAALAQGDRGARDFIAALPPGALVPISATEARDIDTPGDLGSLPGGRDTVGPGG